MITWGVIGAGNVCEVKSVPAIYKTKGSRVKSVMRRDEEKARDYAGRHGIPHWYTSADEIFNDPEIDIVYIATPPSSHAEYAIKTARAGKAAYVEKPMARTYSECLDMIRAFENARLPLFVAYYRRCLPNFLKIKELVDQGAIGEVRTVNILMLKPPVPKEVQQLKENWRVDPSIAGGGYFYDLASHQLDFLDFLLGPVQEARGLTANQAGLYPAEDMVTACFRFESGVHATGTWCFAAGESADVDLTTIVGSRGQIEYASFGDPGVILTTDEAGKELFDFTLPQHIQQPLIEKIMGDLQGTDRCPSTGVTAARTSRVMEMIVYGKNSPGQ